MPTDNLPGADEIVACPLGARLVTAVATVCVVSGLFSCGAATFDSYFGVLAMVRPRRPSFLCFFFLFRISGLPLVSPPPPPHTGPSTLP